MFFAAGPFTHSGRTPEAGRLLTSQQEECVHQVKRMLYGDDTITDHMASGYLDGLAILTTYV